MTELSIQAKKNHANEVAVKNAILAILAIAMTLRRSDGKNVNVSALPVGNPTIFAASRDFVALGSPCHPPHTFASGVRANLRASAWV